LKIDTAGCGFSIFFDPLAMFSEIRCLVGNGFSASTITSMIRRCQSSVTPPKYGSLHTSKYRLSNSFSSATSFLTRAS
jgi:hypothetical protein